jgi:DnaK suppressor protein
MRYLTIEQRSALQALLTASARRLREEIAGERKLANHTEETGDAAVADLETSIDVAALERDVAELRDVEAALARLHTADYGTCASCGEDIPYTRLSAQPAAVQCTACASLAERVRPPSL